MELKRLGDMNYSHLKVDSDSSNDEVNLSLLEDLQKAGQGAGVVITITTAKSGHSDLTITGNQSRHGQQTAVDIALLDGISSEGATNAVNGNPQFREKGNKVKDALLSMGYALNIEVGNDKAVFWQTDTGGNHYNHLHVSNNSGESSPSNEVGDVQNLAGRLTSSSSGEKSWADFAKENPPEVMRAALEKALTGVFNEEIKRIKQLMK